jgi:hypothetical protein
MSILDNVVLRMQWERLKGEVNAFKVHAEDIAGDDYEASDLIIAAENFVEQIESDLEG